MHTYDVGNDPYSRMYWVAHSTPHPDSAPNTSVASPLSAPGNTDDPAAPPKYIGNLTATLAKLAYDQVGTLSTKTSIYADLLQRQIQKCDKHAAPDAVWKLYDSGTIDYNHVVTALRTRWGGIYNAKIAARMRRPYFAATQGRRPPQPGACPLCGRPDGATHIMGECPAHKHLHIERHNKVGRCILKHIRRGAYGAYPIFADVGQNAGLNADFGVIDKSLYPSLVPPPSDPPTCDGSAHHNHQPPHITRFDIALLQYPELNATSGAQPNWSTLPARTPLITLEIGFRSDYDDDNKVLQKRQQHLHTCERLRRHYRLTYQTWDIGYTGLTPSKARSFSLQLGIADPDRMLREIQAIAIKYAHAILQDRRGQERRTMNPTKPTTPQDATPTLQQQRSTLDHTTEYRYQPPSLQRTRAPPR
jgi:hypothetical protein